MSFKKNLEEHFKQFEASPVLFVGSGLSRRYLNINCWEGLMQQFAQHIGQSHIKLKTKANGDLTKYAQLLAKIYSEDWWDTEEAEHLMPGNEELFIDGQSPLKLSISNFIKESSKNMTTDENLIKEIDLLSKANIDGIITTNWDVFLETHFPKFTPFIGQDGLITGRSHGIAEIYKIHGCCTKPNSLVLTENDYDKYRMKNPYLSSKLLTMFIERPVIFLGYSLTDQHIAEILEDIVNCFPDSSLEFLQNKLLFVEWKPELTDSSISDSVIHKKIPVKYVQAPNYVELFEVLCETKKRIPAHLFRTIKDELYQLVLTDDPKGKLYVRDSEQLEDESASTEFVVGYGAISMVKKSESMMASKGLIGLERLDLIRDAVFESGKYDWQQIINEVLPKLCKGNSRVPIFRYLNAGNMLQNNGQLKLDHILADAVAKKYDQQPDSFRSQRW
ncbi:SIR2 family protein [Photobacterium leiognathi]|uniref:SIR2 family protein n=1 Tax=Photobacterium leiognathi TaxID=553611 RepID=UPI00273874C2|nr:SIR2 family protein [Photobacterium leiognathi]